MSPIATELIELFWPAIWSALLGAAAWWQKSQSMRLDSIVSSLEQFRKDIDRIEKEMAQNSSAQRHHVDRLIGATNARFSSIESSCAIYHGARNRRSTDVKESANWAQDSDINGMSGGK